MSSVQNKKVSILPNIDHEDYIVISKKFITNSRFGFQSKGLICYLFALDAELFDAEITIFAQILEPWAQDAVDFFVEIGYITKTLKEEN